MGDKVLVIGSGGREHTLAWKLAQSEHVSGVIGAPGNPGFDSLPEGKGERVNIEATDIQNLARYAREDGIDLTVVGPDDPLALGIVDKFQKAGLKVFGPTKRAARIDASKSFSKNLMKKMNIPTAKFKTFSDNKKALQYIKVLWWA